MYGQVGDWIDYKENDRANASTDGLLKNEFDTMTVRTNVHDISVVIFTVP
jgi:hypothetical protein